MARRRPPERLEQLIEAATSEFERKGLARTLMSDIAGQMGVSQGLLYTYAESKEALLHLAVERIAADGPLELPSLPVATPLPGGTARLIGKLLDQGLAVPALDLASEREQVDDAAAELATIIRQQYAAISRWRRLIAIAEKSSADLPSLKDRFYVRGRRSYVARLASYLDVRIASGQFRPVPDTAIAARLIIETVAWFAYHRHFDPDSRMIEESAAVTTVVDLLVAAFCEVP